jgi:hypothetical protein
MRVGNESWDVMTSCWSRCCCRETEASEAKNIAAEGLLSKTEEGWADENLAADTADLREAAYGGGPHAKFTK